MSTKAFDEFVKQQSAAASGRAADIRRRRTEWLQKLEELYASVSGWLKPYTDQRSVSVEMRRIERREDMLGAYEVDEMRISIGEAEVRLSPVGAVVIGGRGRVDLIGPFGDVRLLLVKPGAAEPGARFNIRRKGVRRVSPPPEVPIAECVWKFITDPPSVRFIDLNEETFFEAVLAVANG